MAENENNQQESGKQLDISVENVSDTAIHLYRRKGYRLD